MAEANGGKRCLNILLLGETGTGKSTLINAFANYSAYSSFAEAAKGEKFCLIPTKFAFTDENSETSTIRVGNLDDVNECLIEGESATMACKSYVFDINDSVDVRWIDTAGFNDTQGEQQDEESVDDILKYAVQYKTIDAIAIVLRAEQKSLNEKFEECVQHVLANLDQKSTIRNLILIFTHGMKPEGALTIVKQKLKEMKEWPSDLQFNKKNIFCFENYAFRELMTIKKELPVNKHNYETIEKVWKKATEEFQRLIDEVSQLAPHDVTETLNNKTALAFVLDVSLSCGLILANINENIEILMTTTPVDADKIHVNDLKIEIREQPQTLCASFCVPVRDLSDGHQVKYFQKICCYGCSIPFGKVNLCQAFRKEGKYTKLCSECPCKVKHHELIYYKATPVDMEFEKMCDQVQARNEGSLKDTIGSVLINLEEERKEITEAASTLAHFKIKKKLWHWKHNKNVEKIANRFQLNITEKRKVNTTDVETIRSRLLALPLSGPHFKLICQAKQTAFNKRDTKVQIKNKIFKNFN